MIGKHLSRCFLLIVCASGSIYSMQATRSIPVEIDNRSSIVLTVIYDEDQDMRGRYGLVFPGNLYTKGIHDAPPYIHDRPELASGKSIRVTTARGHFSIALEDFQNPPMITLDLSNTSMEWTPIQKLLLAGSSKAHGAG